MNKEVLKLRGFVGVGLVMIGAFALILTLPFLVIDGVKGIKKETTSTKIESQQQREIIVPIEIDNLITELIGKCSDYTDMARHCHNMRIPRFREYWELQYLIRNYDKIQ